jgi:hypothetical protein
LKTNVQVRVIGKHDERILQRGHVVCSGGGLLCEPLAGDLRGVLADARIGIG